MGTNISGTGTKVTEKTMVLEDKALQSSYPQMQFLDTGEIKKDFLAWKEIIVCWMSLMQTTVFTKRYTEGSAFISSVVDFQDQDSNV